MCSSEYLSLIHICIELAKKLNVIPAGKYNLLWIVEFPFFDYDEELGQFVAMHHPFTAPLEECLPYLESDKANVRAQCYDCLLYTSLLHFA